MEQTIFNFETETHFKNIDNLKGTLDHMDTRSIVPSFRRTKDPIMLAFEHIDNKPLDKLAKDFVKETITDAFNFISKVFA